MKLSTTIVRPVLSTVLIGMASLSHGQLASDYAADPPFTSNAVPPVVAINLSIEYPMQAEAFTGAARTYENGKECFGRIDNESVCYTSGHEFIGYFDPNKCYEYITKTGVSYTGGNYRTDKIDQQAGTDLTNTENRKGDYFKPVGPATGRTCSGTQFSGNFMNWSTMTALDQFRRVMTGGSRLVDTIGADSQTLLTRTKRTSEWGFVNKRISSVGLTTSSSDGESSTFTTKPSEVSPFKVANLLIKNSGASGNRVTFENGSDNTVLAEFSVIVEVCNKKSGREKNCKAYTDESGDNTWYKPEGIMQGKATDMKFTLLTYTNQDDVARNGGVLRSNAKFIGPLAPQKDGGMGVNPNAEVNQWGQLIKDPDCMLSEHTVGCSLKHQALDAEDGVSNSGIINYINSFGLTTGGYKGYDQIGELFYESFRYFATEGETSRVPVPEYYGESGSLEAISGAILKDNFPIITKWDDPIEYSCQANYTVNISDSNTWSDGQLPGTHISYSDSDAPIYYPKSSTTGQYYYDEFTTYDSNGDPIYIEIETGIPISDVGIYTYLSTNPDAEEGARETLNVKTLTDTVGTLENYLAGKLGTTTRSRDNSGYWVAGLAHYANTEDIRDDHDGKQTIRSFFVDTSEYSSTVPGVGNPLWLAAKYGGFDDANGDKDPGNGDAGAITGEWDENEDGAPDAYTVASNPSNLEEGINNIFNSITANVRASSAPSVTSSSTGEGIVIQAVYKPSHADKKGVKVEWVGDVYALFIDKYNNFREDKDGDFKITNNDPIIQFRSKDVGAALKGVFDRFETTDGGFSFTSTDELDISVDELDTVWSARDQLGALENVIKQRNYESMASDGRYIFTSIDSDGDNIALDTDVVPFAVYPEDDDDSSKSFDSQFRYLGLDSTTKGSAKDIINFIRGEKITGFRSRETDYDKDGTVETWRLGDVVSSSPLLVSQPGENYDVDFGDATYAEFRSKYSNRRQVVYVGANDGMLHAFNAGFYDSSSKRFVTTLDEDSQTAHPLGAELWAYVPYNVLPHLQWLTQVDYPHSFYVDGIPQSFDVNIFDPSAKHPNGWGTILVVGLSFGGGDYTFNPDGDGVSDDDITTRSSYIILDITDPESEPELIAEISHPNMGYTTSRPTLIKNRKANSSTGSFARTGISGETEPDANDWYLVFGSGPYGSDPRAKRAALNYAESDQKGKIFVFDLSSKTFLANSDTSKDYFEVDEAAKGFIGDISSADWNEDYSDNSVYFGTVRGPINSASGDLMRMTVDYESKPKTFTFTKVLSHGDDKSIDRPFTSPPRTSIDSEGNAWIHVGSGRFIVAEDTKSGLQQGYYGIKEEGVTLNVDDLIDVTDIEVYPDSRVRNISNPEGDKALLNGSEVSNFNELKALMSEASGWYVEFDSVYSRHVGRSSIFGVNAVYTEYIPSTDACDPFGATNLHARNFATGTATPGAGFDFSDGLGDEPISTSQAFSTGLVRDVTIVDDGNEGTSIGNQSDGGLVTETVKSGVFRLQGRQSWREIILE